MIPRANKCYKKTVDEFGDSDDEDILDDEICTVVDEDLTVAQTSENPFANGKHDKDLKELLGSMNEDEIVECY